MSDSKEMILKRLSEISNIIFVENLNNCNSILEDQYNELGKDIHELIEIVENNFKEKNE